jgi:hypothetical protein
MLEKGKIKNDEIKGEIDGKECIIGMELYGSKYEGKRVMGMIDERGIEKNVIDDKGLLWEVNCKWKIEEDENVNVVYGKRYYEIVVRGRMSNGKYVMINDGNGGVGKE